MLIPVRAFASAFLPLAALLSSIGASAQQVPKELQPPSSEQVLLRAHARGDQIYTCKADGGQFTWVLKPPKAQLMDDNGKPFGKHFARPSWQANDGSSITGKAIADVPSPDADSIPWLLVTVASHSGDGVLTHVTSVQRVIPRAAKRPHPAAMPRMSVRRSTNPIPPTMYSSHRNKPS
jgi:hypothetical protein